MRVGLMGNKAYSFSAAEPFDVDELIADARSAYEDGLSSYWVGQQADWDAIALLCVLAREVPEIELGTAVTPIWNAFPLHLAQSAASAQMLSGGRFTLGLGLEHAWVMRDMWGLPFERPVSVLEEYLEVVSSLLKTGGVDFSGEFYRVQWFFGRFPPMPDISIILGALGPRMLRLAGAKADGTTTWMTGVKTIREHIVPTIRQAADEAGREEPRVIALLPVAVSDDPQGLRGRITEQMALYHQMPSYQAMLAKEGVSSAGEIAIVGSRSEVEDGLGELADAGATDLGAILFGDDDEQERTREVLRALAKSNRMPEASAR